MKITKIKLLNFRNYEKLDISFSNNLNIIIGDNGSGKSNLVESIYLLAITKSFRTNNEKNLIKKDALSTTITGIIDDNIKTKYELSLSNEKKSVFIDDTKIKKISDYISKIKVVLFNPLDTKIIVDAPMMRRKMLNISLSSLYNEYLILLTNYNTILKNRNAYLKQSYINANSSSEYLNILTEKLVDLGLKIYNYRNEYITKINDNISDIYAKIFGIGQLKIKYVSRFSNKTNEDLLKHYQKDKLKEMEFGKTLMGVHHDDIYFLLDGQKIDEYGSIGQQKNAIISYKLAELLIIKSVTNDNPILILDDLFSELDNKKINNILKMLDKDVQTFITTTNISKINKKLLENSKIIKIKNAQIERND